MLSLLHEARKSFIILARCEFDEVILGCAMNREGVFVHDRPRFIDSDIGKDQSPEPRVLGTGKDEFRLLVLIIQELSMIGKQRIDYVQRFYIFARNDDHVVLL
jgi:hypothetical protein